MASRPNRAAVGGPGGSTTLHGVPGRLVDVLWALLRDGREFTIYKPTATAAA
jgi:hypothetical protein